MPLDPATDEPRNVNLDLVLRRRSPLDLAEGNRRLGGQRTQPSFVGLRSGNNNGSLRHSPGEFHKYNSDPCLIKQETVFLVSQVVFWPVYAIVQAVREGISIYSQFQTLRRPAAARKPETAPGATTLFNRFTFKT